MRIVPTQICRNVQKSVALSLKPPSTEVLLLNLFNHVQWMFYFLDLFKQGKLFHAAIEVALTQETSPEEDVECPECPEEAAGYLQSISHVLEDVTGVRAIESVVEHQSLKYLGIMDCVAMYR